MQLLPILRDKINISVGEAKSLGDRIKGSLREENKIVLDPGIEVMEGSDQ